MDGEKWGLCRSYPQDAEAVPTRHDWNSATKFRAWEPNAQDRSYSSVSIVPAGRLARADEVIE